MARLPPKPREQLDPEQQEMHDLYAKATHTVFGAAGANFVFEEADGAFNGPLPFFAHLPSAGRALFAQMSAIGKLPIPKDAREVAILTTGAHFKAGYETYSHIPQAVGAGLSQQQAEALAVGKRPDGLTDEGNAAYDLADYLCGTPGPLPQDIWDQAVKVLGKDTVVGLLHYIGFYAYTSIGLNAVDAAVPE